MNNWQEAGKQLRSNPTMSVIEAKRKMEKGEVTLLDVREPSEWRDDGYIEGAMLIFFADLPDKLTCLPNDKPIAVMCSVGNRTSIAMSILERAGIKNTINVLGGMTAWTSLNYPKKNKFDA
jgi:hydroxyacylglutathione hydrolase